MRTIKECICDSMEKTEDGCLPICLSYFIRNMAALLVMDSDFRFFEDYPDVTMNGITFGGKAKDNPSIFDVIHVLMGDDLIRGHLQFMQLQGFMIWFLEQNEPSENDDLIMWYNLEFISEKWNEYVRMQD